MRVDLLMPTALVMDPHLPPNVTGPGNVTVRQRIERKANNFSAELSIVVLLFYVHGQLNLTTLFLGRLRPRKGIISTSCTYFSQ